MHQDCTYITRLASRKVLIITFSSTCVKTVPTLPVSLKESTHYNVLVYMRQDCTYITHLASRKVLIITFLSKCVKTVPT